MPCDHKFKEYLNLERLDFEPTTLIVGTFNPSWPTSNSAEWFYGRTRNNNFWDVLPRLYGEDSLINGTIVQWKEFCSRNRIAITDLISSIEDADENNEEHIRYLKGYSDKQITDQFNIHQKTDIPALLRANPTITNVYFTRGQDVFWSALWNPIIDYAQHSQNINNVKMLLTPSKMARYSFGAYNRTNATPFEGSLSDYILLNWTDRWHEI
jgi:hypothetical protein